MKKIVNCWYLLNLLFWVFMPSVLMAQNTPSTGLLSEDDAYDALTLINKKDGSKYPILASGSLKKYCPTPGNQGSIGSCVGWATGYHALTIIKAIQNGITDTETIESQTHSASYIYNRIKKGEDCAKGAYLTEALTFLKRYGTPSSTLFNNSRSDCATRPDTIVAKAALKNRINNFHPIFKSTEKDSIKIEETKLWLARQKPIIIGLNLTSNFNDIALGDTKWKPNLAHKTDAYHAMVVVGYENKEEGGEFELLNSHGPYWGNNGFIKISYEAYGALVKYAFVIDSIGASSAIVDFLPSTEDIPFATAPTKPSSFTELEIRRIKYRADDSHYFETPSVSFNQADNYYTPSQGPWEKKSQYQLIAKNLFTGRYLYAFSFDAQKKVIPIWPLNDWRGLQYTEVIIPSEASVLALNHSGRDYVVLLYSMQPLTDFEERLNIFRRLTGSFTERMQQAFKDVLIEENLVKYAPNDLHFECVSGATSTAVIPLVIAFDVRE